MMRDQGASDLQTSQGFSTRSLGVDRHAGVTEVSFRASGRDGDAGDVVGAVERDRLGQVVGRVAAIAQGVHGDVGAVVVDERVVQVVEVAIDSVISTSSSERAVWVTGSQLTRRLPR